MQSGDDGEKPKSRKAKQQRRNVRGLRAYAAEKQAMFELAYAKMMLAAKLLEDADPEGKAVVVPITTNIDRHIQTILDRVQVEFVEKCEKKASEIRRLKARPPKKLGRPRKSPD